MLCLVNRSGADVLFRSFEQATRGTVREAGALLYGFPCRDRAGQRFSWVTLVVPAISHASATYVEMQEESYLRAEPLVAAPEAAVGGRRPILVGWAHSHPFGGGRGSVFLSGTDRETTRRQFPEPHQVAIVVDPPSGHWGAFGWVDGELKRIRLEETSVEDWRRCFWAPELDGD